jgi:hypothetical protein
MAPSASSVMAMPEAGHREQLPISPGPTAPQPSAPQPSAPQPTARQAPAPGDNRLRPLEVAECSMCGVARPLGLLVPDGNPASTDIRWYCKDVKSCTERWTTAR